MAAQHHAEGISRVLVVEDEAIVAMLLEDMLADLGHEAVVATKIDQATAMARKEQVDFAILDVNLDGQQSYSVADILRTRGIPFVFATGYGHAGLGPEWRHVPALQKPFQLTELERAIREMLAHGPS
jgi:CheY-like chemotaxis protein